MSTITVTNIKATGETTSRSVSGVVAAWVNFNGTGTIAIRDSVNVASLTDNGLGSHTISFSNTMGNANYATQVSGSETGSGGDSNQLGTLERNGTYTTSAVSVAGTHTSSQNNVDNQRMMVTVNGDLS
tara:strand:+ start:875 stop:1258 length:384 start_codon:yes stop_codon:yes gene_type:complete